MAGKYQRYPEYKDSGVEWLGEIPAHWLRGALRYAFKTVRNGSTESQVEQGAGRVPITRIETISSGEINLAKVGWVKENSQLAAYKLNPGDILFSHINSLSMIGNIAQFNGSTPLYHGMNLLRLTPSSNVNTRFVYWWMKSKYVRNSSECSAKPAINQASLSTHNLKEISCLYPPLTEQFAIANFLDHETAKIDALIAKQEKLIELLKEKRQAVISHAVTKGLNPDVPMKDSGIEWLGEVPISWRKTQLRYEVTQFGGGTPSKDNQSFWEGEIPWVSPKDMKTFYIHQTIDNISESAVSGSSVKLIPEGCVLIVVRGMILAHSVPVAKTMKQVTVNQDMKALKPHRYLNSDFLLWLLVGLRDLVLDLVETSAHGTKCLRTQDFERLAIFLPDLKEQENIVNGLVTTVTQIDNTIEKSKKQIELLKERRASLISSAVTGKIDVRNWLPPKTEKAYA